MKVYVSYSTRDRQLVEPIADALQRAGHEVISDRELKPGDVFVDALRMMVDSADVVVVLWTPAGRESEWLVAEAQKAVDLNKYFGVVVGNVDLPLEFRRVQHVSLDSGRHGSPLDTSILIAALQRFEERASSPRASNRTLKQASKRRAPGTAASQKRAQPQSSAATDIDVDQVLEIPAFLRASQSAEQQAGPAPAAPPAAQARPLVPDPFSPQSGAAPGQPEHYDVFISYSRKDAEACELAFSLMAERALVPWYDKDIGGGAFKSKIVTRISNSAVFVLLVSKNSIGSPNVSKELSVASSKDRLIIPISIDGTRPEDLNDTFRYELIELNIFEANPAAPESWTNVIQTIADSVAEVRSEMPPQAVVPIAVPVPTDTVQVPAGPAGVASKEKLRRPRLLAGLTVASGLLQQAAVGYIVWRSGLAAPELAVAAALVAGVVIWPVAYGAALLARMALRRG